MKQKILITLITISLLIISGCCKDECRDCICTLSDQIGGQEITLEICRSDWRETEITIPFSYEVLGTTVTKSYECRCPKN